MTSLRVTDRELEIWKCGDRCGSGKAGDWTLQDIYYCCNRTASSDWNFVVDEKPQQHD